jgi:hypothetical protein
MRLLHYTAAPFIFDPHRAYRQDHGMKPAGLWLSAEDDTDDSFGWRDWSAREDFQLADLTYCTQLALRPGVNVLHIDTAAGLRAFGRRFHRDYHGCRGFIDWAAVAGIYQGLIIYPYQWQVRLDLLWYSGWDCASGCIWDCTTLQVSDEYITENLTGCQ